MSRQEDGFCTGSRTYLTHILEDGSSFLHKSIIRYLFHGVDPFESVRVRCEGYNYIVAVWDCTQKRDWSIAYVYTWRRMMLLASFVFACATRTESFAFEKENDTAPIEDSGWNEEAEDVPTPSQEDTAQDTVVSPCNTEEVHVVSFDSVQEFVEVFEGAIVKIDFDDVDTQGDTPISISEDRYLDSHGVRIRGGEGQYVHHTFRWSDYVAVSAPNMFAPGAPILEEGGYQTEVHFPVEECVAGIGVQFIDADFPELGMSALRIYDMSSQLLYEIAGFAGPSGGAIFQGMVTTDMEGNLVRGIHFAQVDNGSVWPMSSCCEGVTLDDLMIAY